MFPPRAHAAYDLYGSVAYPKHHTQNDISDIYLFAQARARATATIARGVRGIRHVPDSCEHVRACVHEPTLPPSPRR